jgi:hypothetical protein
VTTLIAALLNDVAFDPRAKEYPSVTYIMRDGGTVVRDTVHTY